MKFWHSKITDLSEMDRDSIPYDLQRLLRLANCDSHDSGEVLELAKAINRRANLWSDSGFSEEFGAILTPIAILSSEIFATSRTVIKKENSPCLQSASYSILTYMVSNITENSVKKFLNPLSALCTGNNIIMQSFWWICLFLDFSRKILRFQFHFQFLGNLFIFGLFPENSEFSIIQRANRI